MLGMNVPMHNMPGRPGPQMQAQHALRVRPDLGSASALKAGGLPTIEHAVMGLLLLLSLLLCISLCMAKLGTGWQILRPAL